MRVVQVWGSLLWTLHKAFVSSVTCSLPDFAQRTVHDKSKHKQFTVGFLLCRRCCGCCRYCCCVETGSTCDIVWTSSWHRSDVVRNIPVSGCWSEDGYNWCDFLRWLMCRVQCGRTLPESTDPSSGVIDTVVRLLQCNHLRRCQSIETVVICLVFCCARTAFCGDCTLNIC